MNFPNILKIWGFGYNVSYYPESFVIGDEPAVGGGNHFEKQIKVKTSYDSQTTLEILFHEVIHMVCNEVMEDLEDHKPTEHQINTIANGMTSVLLNNPMLLRKIQEIQEETHEKTCLCSGGNISSECD